MRELVVAMHAYGQCMHVNNAPTIFDGGVNQSCDSMPLRVNAHHFLSRIACQVRNLCENMTRTVRKPGSRFVFVFHALPRRIACQCGDKIRASVKVALQPYDMINIGSIF